MFKNISILLLVSSIMINNDVIDEAAGDSGTSCRSGSASPLFGQVVSTLGQRGQHGVPHIMLKPSAHLAAGTAAETGSSSTSPQRDVPKTSANGCSRVAPFEAAGAADGGAGRVWAGVAEGAAPSELHDSVVPRLTRVEEGQVAHQGR